MKGPRAVMCETFTLPDAKPVKKSEKKDPLEEFFTPVSKSEAWLVEAVSGKHYSQRVLKRSTVFQDLKSAALRRLAERQTAPAAAGEDPLMSALRYEDDPEEKVEATPVRKRRRTSGNQEQDGMASPEKTLSALATDNIPVTVRMNKTATLSPEKLQDVRVVLRGKALLLGVSSVPWLMGYLVQEMEDGGVAVDVEASVDAEPGAGTIFWDFRDEAWVAKVRTDTGEYITKRAAIKSRMRTPGDSLHGMSRNEAKEAAREELCAWREAAQRGEVDDADASADAETFHV